MTAHPMTEAVNNAIDVLIRQANEYKGDNIYQDVFYHSEWVDADASADAGTGVVILAFGGKLVWDEQTKEWQKQVKLPKREWTPF